MEISITVDFGKGYVVQLTPHDAQFLHQQLKQLFSVEQETYEIPETSGYISSVPMTAFEPIDKNDAEVEKTTEESPETLRDPGPPHNIHNCYRYNCVPCETLMGPKGTC